MTFIVKWYGDQPDDAAWYLARAHGLPFAFLLGSLALGAAVPILGCAWERVRANARAMRVVGLSTMLGIFCSRSLAGERGKRLGRPCGVRRRRCDGRPVAGPRPAARPAICSPAAARGEVSIDARRGRDRQPQQSPRRRAATGSALSYRRLRSSCSSAPSPWSARSSWRRRSTAGRIPRARTISPTPASESHVLDEGREPPDIRVGTVAAILAGFLLFVVCAASGLVVFLPVARA